MIFTVFGIAVLALVGFWLFGGVVLRGTGVVFVFVGLVSLVTLADPVALLMVVIGLVMWLAGHWHFALRHHEYKSALAQRIFLQLLPPRYDPTRHWGTPVVSQSVEPERGNFPEPPSRPDDSSPAEGGSGNSSSRPGI
jgi:hypothetical protein